MSFSVVYSNAERGDEKMNILEFKIKRLKLIRIDANKLITYNRNYLKALFTFDSEWQGISPIVAQFAKDDEVYDVFIEDGQCNIPWEVLQSEGAFRLSVMGGDLLVTNTLEINVYSSGLLGGLVSTTASPGVYSEVLKISENIQADWENSKNLLDTYKSDINIAKNEISESKN